MEKQNKKADCKPKKVNPWMVHLAKVRKANPMEKNIAILSKIAKASYKKK